MLNYILKYPIIFLWKRRLLSNSKNTQEVIFKTLIDKAKETQFGIKHGFENIKTYDDFKKKVPIRHYQDLKPYMDKILAGEENVLWPSQYQYLLATSKSTGDAIDKFIPISNESLKNLINISLDMLLNFAVKTKNYSILLQRGLYLSASPELERKGKYPHGHLSGISYYLKPKMIRDYGFPSYKTNCIKNWEKKIIAIENEIIDDDLGIIVGTPPWVNKLLHNLSNRVQKPLNQHFKSLKLFMFGGAPIELYRKQIQKILGNEVYLLENYPATEGFIAYQDEFPSKGLLLQTGYGIFFEFIKKEDYYKSQFNRILLKDIELNQEYALVLNTNSGLFSYIIGDIVKFSSKTPHRFTITGRLRHFLRIEDFYLNDGDLSTPLYQLIQQKELPIGEFTFAPGNQSIDFYYETKNNFKISDLSKLEIEKLLKQKINFVHIQENSAYQYMKDNYKVGGQYKITRIRNDRNIVDFLDRFLITN